MTNSETRFKSIDFNILPGKCFKTKNDLNSKNFYKKESIEFLDFVKTIKFDEIVHQNKNFISNLLIEKYVKKSNKNVSKTFISDSIGINAKEKTIAKIKTYIYLFLNFNKFSYKFNLRKIFSYSNYLKDYSCYISINKIENLATHFISFENLLQEINSNSYIKELFIFKIENDFDIIFFTQPILQQSVFSNEVKNNYEKIIKEFIKVTDSLNKQIRIKVHPSEKVEFYKKYENKNCKVLEINDIPAEILFYNYKNKLIISFFSSISCFDYSNSNKHIWMYPLLKYNPNIKIENNRIQIINKFESLIEEIKKV